MSEWVAFFSLVSFSDFASVSIAFQNFFFYPIEGVLLNLKPSALAFSASVLCFAFRLFQNRLYR